MNEITTAAEGEHGRKSYDADFFIKLADVESRHFWFRTRNEVIATLLRQCSEGWSNGFRVLEIGCGNGNVLQALQKACPRGIVVGMDLFAEGLAFARRRSSCGLVQGDIERPPFGVRFDCVGAFDVIEHLPDDLRILRSLREMLRPGGLLLVTVPANQSLWSYFDEASHHCRRYEADELRRKLNEAGLDVEFLSHFMASTYPLMWVRRKIGSLKSRRLRSAETNLELTLKELQIVPGLNGLLAFILRQEAKRIRARKTLPFGSSLIAAARRTP